MRGILSKLSESVAKLEKLTYETHETRETRLLAGASRVVDTCCCFLSVYRQFAFCQNVVNSVRFAPEAYETALVDEPATCDVISRKGQDVRVEERGCRDLG